MVGVVFIISLFNLRQRHTTYLLTYLLLLEKASITLTDCDPKPEQGSIAIQSWIAPPRLACAR